MCLGHISNSDTFFIDPIKSTNKSECPICLKMSHWEGGYIGVRHLCCKVVYDSEEFMGSIAKKRRELILKLTRKELGKILGYSPKTIKQYEWVRCSNPYFNKLTAYVRKLNEEEAAKVKWQCQKCGDIVTFEGGILTMCMNFDGTKMSGICGGHYEIVNEEEI